MKIAILGCGTVGSGLAALLTEREAALSAKAGCPLQLGYILEIRDLPDSPFAGYLTKDIAPILADPAVAVVAEAIGGLHPAGDFVRAALSAGKSVVTSNKELVAEQGAALLALAREKGVHFLFEASVGGGIPVIRPLHACLAANRIDEVAGILNGTTNYILTRMQQAGGSFDEMLADARRLGYAEADPTADISGADACRKTAILASLAFGSTVLPAQIPTEGIGHITTDDLAAAAALGRVIKLIGRARRLPDGKVAVRVGPVMLPKGSQLAGVSDVFNGILVKGDAVGEVLFYGRGAGALPTASAMVSDILEAVREPAAAGTLTWGDRGDVTAPPAAAPAVFCRRIAGPGTPAARQAVAAIWGAAQWVEIPGGCAFVAPPETEAAAAAAEKAYRAAGGEILSAIRLLDI